MKFTLPEVEKIARDFLSKTYDLELSIPIKINNRLTTTLGRFRWRRLTAQSGRKMGVPLSIEISGKYLRYGDSKDIVSTIKHECCHYALFVSGLPFRDGDTYFENELKRYGINPSGTSYFEQKRNVRVYECRCDEHIFLRTISPSYCKNCLQDLVYKEQRLEWV